MAYAKGFTIFQIKCIAFLSKMFSLLFLAASLLTVYAIFVEIEKPSGTQDTNNAFIYILRYELEIILVFELLNVCGCIYLF